MALRTVDTQDLTQIRSDNPTLVLWLGKLGKTVARLLEARQGELQAMGASSPGQAVAFAELDESLAHALGHAERLMGYESLLHRRSPLERQRPRLDVVVIGALTEPDVRCHLQPRLARLHSVLLHHMGSIFDRFRTGHDRTLMILPVLSTGYVPRDPQGEEVSQALKELLEWLEAIPAADFVAEETAPTIDFGYVGGSAELSLELDGLKENLVAQVLNSNGDLVRTLPLGCTLPGIVDIKWDGLTRTGQAAKTGQYTLRFQPRAQSSDYEGFIDQVFVLDDVTDTSVLTSAEVTDSICNFLELMLYSGLRNASESDEDAMLPAGRDLFQRVGVGRSDTRLSTFSCAAFDIPVYRIQRYCARKAVLEGLRVLRQRPQSQEDEPSELQKNRDALTAAQKEMAGLNIDDLGKELFRDLQKRAFPRSQSQDDEEGEPDEEQIPLMATNQTLIDSFGASKLQADQQQVRKLWSHYQHSGMDTTVRHAAARAYELADGLGLLLRRSIDIVLGERYVGVQWAALEEAEAQMGTVQSDYEAALESRNRHELSAHPETKPLSAANETVVETIKDRPDPAKMKTWGLVLATIIGLSLGELAFVKYGVNPLVDLGQKATWFDRLVYVALPYLGGFAVGVLLVGLALWIRLKRATDKVQDAYDSYLAVFRRLILDKSSASLYRYYETRLDLLFRQEVVRASMRAVTATQREHRRLMGIDESLRIQIRTLEEGQEALGVVINRDGSEQLAGLLGKTSSVLRQSGLSEHDIRPIYCKRVLGVDEEARAAQAEREIALQILLQAAGRRALEHLFADFRERISASDLDELLVFGSVRAEDVLLESLIPEYAREHLIKFLSGHLPNLTTGLDWDGNVLSPLGPERLSAKQGERSRQYLMRLEAQPMMLTGPQQLEAWLEHWEETQTMLISKRMIPVESKPDVDGIRPDRENRLYLARIVQGLPLQAARSLQPLATWFDKNSEQRS